MSARVEPVRDPLTAVAEDRRLHYFRTLLKDFEIDVSTKFEQFDQFRQWLEELSSDVVLRSHQKHYNPTYMNLLSVFGDEMANEEVHSLAIKCIRTKHWNECEYFFYLSQLLGQIKSGQGGAELLRLKGWDGELINSLLSRGRGLIICSFRFGAIRYLPIEIALRGFAISEVVNQVTHEVMQSAFDSLGPWHGTSFVPAEAVPQAENIRLLKSVNAEDPGCTVELVDALKRREILGFCVEGNTGSDGPWGDTSKSTIDFLGHRIAAKNGAARLAAALRAPILPVMALREGEAGGRLVFSEPIIPPPGLKRSETEKFVQVTMQSLYTLLETYVRRYPEQWEGWSALHRWRVHDHDADTGRRVSDPQTIARLLRDGKKFMVNPRRVAQLPTKDGVMWVDLKTLKGFQNPNWAGQENVLAALSESCGLDLAWITRSKRDRDWEEKICLLLAYLQQSDLVAAR